MDRWPSGPLIRSCCHNAGPAIRFPASQHATLNVAPSGVVYRLDGTCSMVRHGDSRSRSRPARRPGLLDHEGSMLRRLLLTTAAAAIPALSAAAAPATPEEAARLKAVFERYVSQPAPGETSGVKVEPKGDAYALTIDLKRAAAGLSSFGVTVDPYVTAMTLAPLPDGTWKVHSDDSPPLVLHVGQQTMTFAAASSAFDGVFDPKLHTYASFRQEQTGYTSAQTAPTLDQNRRVDKIVLSQTGTPADGGSTTIAAHYTAAGTAADIMFKPGPAAPVSGNPAVPPPPRPGTSLAYTAPDSVADIGIERLRVGSLLDLWAFLVAHPNHDSLVASQSDLKALLQAGLPLLDALKENGSLSTLAVTTPIGVVTAKTLGGSIDAAGLSGTGSLSTAISIADLAIPPGQLPPWSAGLVPKALDLHVALDGFHATEAAQSVVRDVDLSKDVVITPEQKEAASHLFWPGAGTVTLAPSRLSTAALDLKMDGHAAMGPTPSGSVTITGTGLDKEIAALQAQAATDPGAGQILGPLVLAKNLAKPNPDGSLTWVIAFGSGPLTINGATLQ